MKHTILFSYTILAIVCAFSTTAMSEPLRVAVSIPPQKYFVERIAGDLAEVSVMVPPGSDPHTYEPKPRQLVALAKTSLYFAVGIDIEKAWLPRFQSVNNTLVIVHTDRSIKKIPSAAHHDEHPPEAHDNNHRDHDGFDPHSWLAPSPARAMAHEIATALSKADPANTARYETGFNALEKDMTTLDDELTALFKNSKGAAFMVFHPSWGYFAEAYGLEQEAVEIGGKEPGPADLARLITFARDHHIKAIFVQPQFSRKSAQTIADAVNGKVIVADPLAENWLDNLRSVARSVAAAIK